ncbi:hypothetical protein [Bacillus halotolerans]|uniref:hypothetical protein n=1 Tax=Bacillus halotolerans TaxID=260554 RepID=UPI0016623570|nr:hypothetical protein [Bacillus halotolerans]MBV7321656.1 hypothetical protein [Halalkalibacterium halodurans]QNS20507.1 hypothetical protein ICJ61_01115 [Bacillus halotolerans]
MYYYYPQYQLVPIPCDYRYYPQNHPEGSPEESEFRVTFKPDTFIRASVEGLFDNPRRIFIRSTWWDGSVQRVRIIYADGKDVRGGTFPADRIEVSAQYQQQSR